MSGKSQYFTDAILNLLRATNVTAPATVYVGLLSAAPADDNASGTELVAANGYARQAIAFGAPATDSTSGSSIIRKVANTGVITFGPASADWLAAVGFGIYDAVSGGNLLYWAPLDATRTTLNGDIAQYAIGALKVTED